VRLIGQEWSEKMDALLNDMELKYLHDKPENPASGQIKLDRVYLCSVSDCWHRARVVGLNEKESEANCFFIDQGDFETLKFDELFECPGEFMKLPAQAFSVSLFGLEDFIENPNSNVHLEEALHWKSLIGKIMSKKVDFETQNRIDVKLFDTSSEVEDVDLNELILDKILSSNPLPCFNPNGMNNVKITHIDDYIYCQSIESFNYINGLIMNLIKSNWNKAEHQGLYPENVKNLKRFYLIFDAKRNNWFRASIVSAKADKKTFTMNFVDAGIVEDVEISNIYRIDKISIALTLYPAQVIKFKLFRIEMTEGVKSRLRAWLPLNKDAMVS
jgi:tudor domain-containing protein 1/4/6/7